MYVLDDLSEEQCKFCKFCQDTTTKYFLMNVILIKIDYNAIE